jgi:hypothetical protein
MSVPSPEVADVLVQKMLLNSTFVACKRLFRSSGLLDTREPFGGSGFGGAGNNIQCRSTGSICSRIFLQTWFIYKQV